MNDMRFCHVTTRHKGRCDAEFKTNKTLPDLEETRVKQIYFDGDS